MYPSLANRLTFNPNIGANNHPISAFCPPPKLPSPIFGQRWGRMTTTNSFFKKFVRITADLKMHIFFAGKLVVASRSKL